MCHHEKATKISKKIISHFTGVILFWDRILSTALWSGVLFVPCDVDFVKSWYKKHTTSIITTFNNYLLIECIFMLIIYWIINQSSVCNNMRANFFLSLQLLLFVKLSLQIVFGTYLLCCDTFISLWRSLDARIARCQRCTLGQNINIFCTSGKYLL